MTDLAFLKLSADLLGIPWHAWPVLDDLGRGYEEEGFCLVYGPERARAGQVVFNASGKAISTERF
jgi:hypothetical protein